MARAYLWLTDPELLPLVKFIASNSATMFQDVIIEFTNSIASRLLPNRGATKEFLQRQVRLMKVKIKMMDELRSSLGARRRGRSGDKSRLELRRYRVEKDAKYETTRNLLVEAIMSWFRAALTGVGYDRKIVWCVQGQGRKKDKTYEEHLPSRNIVLDVLTDNLKHPTRKEILKNNFGRHGLKQVVKNIEKSLGVNQPEPPPRQETIADMLKRAKKYYDDDGIRIGDQEKGVRAKYYDQPRNTRRVWLTKYLADCAAEKKNE